MQQPRRFQAATLSEAYAMVRAELGGEAVILSTRKATSPGLFGQPGRQFVEVVAHLPTAAEEPATRHRPTLAQDIAAHELVRGVAEAAASGIAIDPAIDPARELAPEVAPPFVNERAGTVRDPALVARALSADGPLGALHSAVAAEAPAAAAPLAETLATPPSIADRAMMGMLARQLTEVRSLLDQLVIERTSARVEGGPPALREIHDLLVRQGLTPSLFGPLLTQVSEALVRGHDREAALRTVERKLAAKLPPPPRVEFARRPLAIFLVGPAGAGKTTFAVRLALEIERAHSLRVAIAGTDVNRAGGPQQLAAYGAAAGIDARLCYAPAELQALLGDGTADVVIVDSPGHNGARRDRMAELNAFTQVARRPSVLLVLPATMKATDLNDVTAAYSAIGLDGLVLTRCDETATFGAFASVAIEAAIGVAYTTHSDQVSDPPRAGDNLALAGAVATGRWVAAPPARVRPPAAGRALARVS